MLPMLFNKFKVKKRRQIKISFFLLTFFFLILIQVTGQPAGSTIYNPIILNGGSAYSAGSFSYSDTKNNSVANGFTNDMGNASDDIYYKVVISNTAQVSVSLCASTFDTYLYLLNGSGSVINSNDDNGPLCSGTSSSIQTTLSAGTYYIVTEGYGTNSGNLVLNATLVVQAPPPPTVYDTRNFVRAFDVFAPLTDVNSLPNLTAKDVLQSTKYFDGIGRQDQSVVKKGALDASSGNFFDLVGTIEYDAFGRKLKEYLPFAVNSTGGNISLNDGAYKKVAVDQQRLSFFNTLIGDQGESDFYSKTEYAADALSREKRVLPPGVNWAGSGKGAEKKYWLNTASDQVQRWESSSNGSFSSGSFNYGAYKFLGYYEPGQLIKNVSINENGSKVIDFVDKEGRTVLKRVQLTGDDNGLGASGNGWSNTVYIYDDFGSLRCVIQPLGYEKLGALVPGQTVSDQTIVNELCFQYAYDFKNRMIAKKVPGAGDVLMVYDYWDRLVMVQDANMRNTNQWQVTKYDDLGRAVETGLWISLVSFDTHSSAARATNGIYPSISGTYEVLTRTGYDSYSNLPAGAGLATSYEGFWDTELSSATSVWPYTETVGAKTSNLQGLVTWTQVKVLNSSPDKYIYTLNVYDTKNRLIQSKVRNEMVGGVDVVTNRYSWSGRLISSVSKQEIPNVLSPVVVTTNSYDELWRIKTIAKKVKALGSGLQDEQRVIADYQYNLLGQVSSKNIGQKPGGYLENQKYDYNVRGWLLGINRDYLSQEGSYFGFELGYEKASSKTGTPFSSILQYSGNIAGMTWRSKGDGVLRRYNFGYDQMSRLVGADFIQKESSGSWGKANLDFSVTMGDAGKGLAPYDINGNILAMVQQGWKLGGPFELDHLEYKYFDKSNKLMSVSEPIPVNNKLGDFTDNNTTGADYGYDKNGNLVSDLNKKMVGATGTDLISGGAMSYNYLNLPSSVTMSGSGTIVYTYDATGQKMSKVVNEAASASNGNIQTVTTTKYLGGNIYESKVVNGVTQYSDKLLFGGYEEGRFRPMYKNVSNPNQITGLAFDYMLKDHLGNVRMVLTDEVQNDIYPVLNFEGNESCAANYYVIEQGKIVPKFEVAELNYPNNNGFSSGSCHDGTGFNAKLYKLQASAGVADIGLGITLKVMAGDKVNIFGKSYYNVSGGGSNSVPVSAIITGLVSGALGGSAALAKGATVGNLSANPGTIAVGSFLQDPNRGDGSTVPVASLNYVIFDEQFNYVSGGFSKQVGALTDHASVLGEVTIPKSGYIYVYASNQSITPVYFDNIQVTHTRGPILEETHYYPFGLTMAGISSKALTNTVQNKIKFQGQEFASKEFSDGSGVDMYEFKWRMHDPQIGRFWQIDPLADKYIYNSTYAFSENHVTSHRELEGLEKISIHSQSFIPYKTIGLLGEGGKYRGDNRGFGDAGTSRISATIDLNLSGTKGITRTDENYDGADTYSSDGELITYSDANGSSKLSGNKTVGAISDANLTFEIAGNNDAISGSPNINVKGNLFISTLDFQDGSSFAAISGRITGDKFPANETFITDNSGTRVFLGVSGADGRPLTSLPGEDNNRQMSSFTIGISFNAKGNVTGVSANGKTYTVEDWNKLFTRQKANSDVSTSY